MAHGTHVRTLHHGDHDPKERRLATRKPLNTRADVVISSTHVMQSHAVDISSGGIGLVCAQQLKQGQKLTIRLKLSACGLQRDIEITGSVCFCLAVGERQFRVGLQFVHLDEDTAGFIDALCA